MIFRLVFGLLVSVSAFSAPTPPAYPVEGKLKIEAKGRILIDTGKIAREVTGQQDLAVRFIPTSRGRAIELATIELFVTVPVFRLSDNGGRDAAVVGVISEMAELEAKGFELGKLPAHARIGEVRIPEGGPALLNNEAVFDIVLGLVPFANGHKARLRRDSGTGRPVRLEILAVRGQAAPPPIPIEEEELLRLLIRNRPENATISGLKAVVFVVTEQLKRRDLSGYELRRYAQFTNWLITRLDSLHATETLMFQAGSDSTKSSEGYWQDRQRLNALENVLWDLRRLNRKSVSGSCEFALSGELNSK